MASPTRVNKKRRAMRKQNMGQRRKKLNARKGSTPSQAALFGDSPARKG